MLKVSVVGLGYVGLSLSILLSRKIKVIGLDVVKEKIDLLKNNKSPIVDNEIQNCLDNEKLNIEYTLDEKYAYSNADIIIIATPTNYDDKTNSFNTNSVEYAIKKSLEYNKSATIVIKSTIPIGFTDKMSTEFNYKNFVFSPEFLREGKALYDNLYPDRIIVGCDITNDDAVFRANQFATLLKECSKVDSVPILVMPTREAESVKLFSNTYLAMRVAYFNELDSFAFINNLSSKNIIEGVCADKRIGSYYNNPSFGYGGYCLPKDSKQLLNEYEKHSSDSLKIQSIIESIVTSNKVRKDFIVKSIEEILKKCNKSDDSITIGVYRLNMKKDSDNYRDSSIINIIEALAKKYSVLIYEPIFKEKEFNNCKIINKLDDFKRISDIVLTNRMSEELNDIKDKVFTRDIYCRD